MSAASNRMVEKGGRKFALVASDILSQLKKAQQVSEQTSSSQLKEVLDLDTQIQSILAKENIPSEIKAHMYAEALSSFLTMRKRTPEIAKQQAGEPLSSEPIPADLKANASVVEPPSTNKNRQRSELEKQEHKKRFNEVLRFIDNNKESLSISFNDEGELLMDGMPMEGSNKDAILNFITQKLPSNKPITHPPGSGYLLERLAYLGSRFDRKLIPSQRLKDFMKRFDQAPQPQKPPEQKGGASRKLRKEPPKQIVQWIKLFY